MTTTDQQVPTIEEFREECLAFLEANAKRRSGEDQPFLWGEGPDDVGLFEEVDRDVELQRLAEAKAWRARRDDAGLAWITGPPELGGRGLPAAYEREYNGLESQFSTPAGGFFGIGLGMVAPTILAHAQDHVKAKYLLGLYRGDIVGAQLFSEPAAGSDLASLTMRAERDGDEWVLNGQKVWTSGAQYSDIGEVICRTDQDLPKHKGLTGFVIDMKAPGVDVRPLRQMTGGASFNEVFLTDVRVPDDHRLGDVNQGWTVALTTLMNERASIGGGSGGSSSTRPVRFIEMLRHFGLSDDPIQRQRLVDLHIHQRVATLNSQRGLAKLKAGQAPGPEMSTAKLALTMNMQRQAAFVSGVLGTRMTADTGEWGTFSWSKFVCGIPGMRVAGGTDEVMRNIVAERVLGLPKEPGIDTKSPFKDLAVNRD